MPGVRGGEQTGLELEPTGGSQERSGRHRGSGGGVGGAKRPGYYPAHNVKVAWDVAGIWMEKGTVAQVSMSAVNEGVNEYERCVCACVMVGKWVPLTSRSRYVRAEG